MDTFLGLSATAWTAIYTILTCLLLVTAWVAAGIAGGQWKASRVALQDARRAQQEANRPYVIVTAEATIATRTCFDLSIRNIGKRPAFDVSIVFDPPPKAALDTEQYAIAKLKMLTEPIAMIAPEQEMRALWDSYLSRNAKEDLPKLHRVKFTYRDSSGHQYHEESVVDLDAMKGVTYMDEKTIHDVGKSLEEIRKVLQGASLLSSKGSVEVDATVETRQAREEREVREDYARLRHAIEDSKAWSMSDPKQTAQMEDMAARLEAAHPRLQQDEATVPEQGVSRTKNATAKVAWKRRGAALRHPLWVLLKRPSPRGSRLD